MGDVVITCQDACGEDYGMWTYGDTTAEAVKAWNDLARDFIEDALTLNCVCCGEPPWVRAEDREWILECGEGRVASSDDLEVAVVEWDEERGAYCEDRDEVNPCLTDRERNPSL
jgi:hypothetical protein